MNDSPDLAAVTEVQQKTWSKGDFAMVANLVYIAAENLAEALDLVPGERVLDVACGSGNAAIAAARRTWGGTVGADYVPALLERGRERAAAERLEIEFVEADAQDLPFEDAELRRRDVDLRRDVRPRPARRPRPSCCAWSSPAAGSGWPTGRPDGAVGRMFKTIAKHAPPPPGVESPLLWGTEEHLRELFGDGISDLRVERASRASRSAPPTTTSSSSAPTSAPPRRPTNGSGRRASRPSPTTCAPSWSRRTPPETGRWCSRPSTCRPIATRA